MQLSFNENSPTTCQSLYSSQFYAQVQELENFVFNQKKIMKTNGFTAEPYKEMGQLNKLGNVLQV